MKKQKSERYIRIAKGIALSLLLHLLILLLFVKNFQEVVFPAPQPQDQKISINLQQIVTPPPAPKPKPIPQPIIPPVPEPVVKPIVEKVVEPKPEVQEIKKKVLDESKKVFAQKSTEENNVTKIEPKPKKKVVKKKVEPKPKKIVKKKIIKKKRVVKKKTYRKPKRRKSKDSLANMLMGSGTAMYPTQPKRTSGAGSYGEHMIKQLYGSEFNTYSSTQKKFIRNNLSTIHQITQRTLSRNGYPDIAVRTRQQGTNIVSFYLHPNGDITGLRLKKSLGYSSLDKNTLKVIRLAYKDYPLPNKKTRLIFYVRYSIY